MREDILRIAKEINSQLGDSNYSNLNEEDKRIQLLSDRIIDDQYMISAIYNDIETARIDIANIENKNIEFYPMDTVKSLMDYYNFKQQLLDLKKREIWLSKLVADNRYEVQICEELSDFYLKSTDNENLNSRCANCYEIKKIDAESTSRHYCNVLFDKIVHDKLCIKRMKELNINAPVTQICVDLVDAMNELKNEIPNLSNKIKKEYEERYKRIILPEYMKILSDIAKQNKEMDNLYNQVESLKNKKEKLKQETQTADSFREKEIQCEINRINYEIDALRVDIQVLSNKGIMNELAINYMEGNISLDDYNSRKYECIDTNKQYKDEAYFALAKRELFILNDEKEIILTKVQVGLISNEDAKKQLKEIDNKINYNFEISKSSENENTSGRKK